MKELSKFAQTVLKKRYLLPGETPAWMMQRVATALAEPTIKFEGKEMATIDKVNFYNVLASLDFLPNSPALANAGARTGQLAACFVVGVPDDLGGIFTAIRTQALIHQTGGGTGFAFSRLREKGAKVNSTGSESSGPLSFMAVFNAATESIKQGGMRRGANMGMLRIDHPDVLEFIRCKEDLDKLTNFNISLAVTAKFMKAVDEFAEFELVSPETGPTGKKIWAAEVWKEIVSKAWATGEPGVIFIDRANEECPVPWLGQYEATNPCGEQPLLPNESCNLGSINLENMVTVDKRLDVTKLINTITIAARMLENVVEANKYIPAVPEIEIMSKATRKTGLGVMGFARMLYKLGIPYSSPEALEVAAQVMALVDYHSKLESISTAKTRGSFSALEGHEAEFIRYFKRICAKRGVEAQKRGVTGTEYEDLTDLVAVYGIRNSNTTTVAPTGTLSIIADTSGGCEPVFALAFIRTQADEKAKVFDEIFLEALKEDKFSADEIEIIFDAVDAHHGSLKASLTDGRFQDFSHNQFIKLVNLAAVFETAHDISPTQHVLVQAAFQAFNDSAVSKTINFAEDATIEDVKLAYELAYKEGCKGITVYRNNSRAYQPLSTEGPAAPAQPLATCCPTPLHHMAEGCIICKSCGASACTTS